MKTDTNKSEKPLFPKHVLAVFAFLLLVVLINFAIHFGLNVKKDLYQNIAVSMIITWIVFLIAYYIWAIHFYNVNMGWTDHEWDELKARKAVTPELEENEPDENPHCGESLGLPPGTVRATIALSLLVAGLAMTIASLSMNNTIPPDAVFVDNFEFFKNAFLMMIAFYFGAKTLEFLDKKNVDRPASGTAPASSTDTVTVPQQVPVQRSAPVQLRQQADETGEDKTLSVLSAPLKADVEGPKPTFDDPNSKG